MSGPSSTAASPSRPGGPSRRLPARPGPTPQTPVRRHGAQACLHAQSRSGRQVAVLHSRPAAGAGTAASPAGPAVHDGSVSEVTCGVRSGGDRAAVQAQREPVPAAGAKGGDGARRQGRHAAPAARRPVTVPLGTPLSLAICSGHALPAALIQSPARKQPLTCSGATVINLSPKAGVFGRSSEPHRKRGGDRDVDSGAGPGCGSTPRSTGPAGIVRAGSRCARLARA